MFIRIIEYLTSIIEHLTYNEWCFYTLVVAVIMGFIGGKKERDIQSQKDENTGYSPEIHEEDVVSGNSEPIIEQYDRSYGDSVSDNYYDDRSALERYLDEHEGSALERYLDREEAALEHYLDDEYAYSSSDDDVFDDTPSATSIPDSKNEGWYGNTDYEDPADMYDDDEKF